MKTKGQRRIIYVFLKRLREATYHVLIYDGKTEVETRKIAKIIIKFSQIAHIRHAFCCVDLSHMLTCSLVYAAKVLVYLSELAQHSSSDYGRRIYNAIVDIVPFVNAFSEMQRTPSSSQVRATTIVQFTLHFASVVQSHNF